MPSKMGGTWTLIVNKAESLVAMLKALVERCIKEADAEPNSNSQ